jgi:hypothetical protein
MLQILSRLWRQKAPTARATGPRGPRGPRLEVEALEGRLVPSAISLYPAPTQSPSNAVLSSLVQNGGIHAVAPSTGFISFETPNERFVDHLYSDLLHTAADQQTVASIGTQLDQHQLARIDVVRSITFSWDYGQVVTRDLVQAMLHRAYTDSNVSDVELGLQFSMDLVTVGHNTPWLGGANRALMTREDLAAAIATNPEYLQTRGGGTFDGWLNALFADALHRAPTPAERTRFSSAGVSLTTARTVFRSQEHQLVALNDFYQQFLHRPLDPAGQTYWLGRYQAGVWTEEILAEMLESDDYFQICQL